MLPFLKNNQTTGFTDQPAQVDLFNIDVYVNCLATFIEKCNTPITISIQGTWGSGKTSFMTLVKDRLPKDKVSVIWYNTWQFSQFDCEKNIASSLMTVLMSSMSEAGGVKSENAKKFASVLKNAAFTATAVALDTLVGGRAAALVGTMAKEPEDNIDSNLRLVTSIQQLKEQFQNMINEHLAQTGKERIVIFVDDLDRLDPLRAVELLEVLKLFLDCEKCVFVLAIDYDVVCRGVAAKYNFTEDEMDKGRSFFDKIIQVPFKLPIASYDLHRYIKQCLGDIGIEVKDDELDTYEALIRNSQGTNPRSMKRLFNAFLLLNIMTSLNKIEVDNKLLFAALCLQFLNENFYNFFVSNALDFTEQDLSNILSGDFSLCEELFQDEDVDVQDYTACESFFNIFLKVLKPEDSEKLSKEQLDQFKSVMSLSATTASSSVDSKKKPELDGSKGYRLDDKIFVSRFKFFEACVDRYLQENPKVTYHKLKEAFSDPRLPAKLLSAKEVHATFNESTVRSTWQNSVTTGDGVEVLLCANWMERHIVTLMDLVSRKFKYDVEIIDNTKDQD